MILYTKTIIQEVKMIRNTQQTLETWLMSDRPPLILDGARQVGKTWLAKNLADIHKYKSHYINFESDKNFKNCFAANLDTQTISNELSIQLDCKIGPHDLIIFDEIQECPNALTSLKYFHENSTNRVLAAGSLLGIALTGHSFPVGKVEFLKIFPLTFDEFLLNLNYLDLLSDSKKSPSAHQKLSEAITWYLYSGGMPAAIKILIEKYKKIDGPAIKQIRKVQNDILSGYEKDFRKHSEPEDAMQLTALYKNIANQLVQYQEGTVKRFKFKGVISGKKEYSQFQSYFEWLKENGLVYLNHVIDSKPNFPLDSCFKESFFKVFYSDIGLINARLRIPVDAFRLGAEWSYKGFILENFVAQHLASWGKPLCSWKTERAEIEFLIENETNFEIYPIEVKSRSRNRAKSLKSYCERYNPSRFFKFSLDPEPNDQSLQLYNISILKE